MTTDEKHMMRAIELAKLGEGLTRPNPPVGAVLVMEDYIVALVAATRRPEELDGDLEKYIQVSVSPRGSIALDKCSRAYAWLQGREQVTPDDIRAVINDCLRHRLALSFEAQADGLTTDDVISQLVKLVAVA